MFVDCWFKCLLFSCLRLVWVVTLIGFFLFVACFLLVWLVLCCLAFASSLRTVAICCCDAVLFGIWVFVIVVLFCFVYCYLGCFCLLFGIVLVTYGCLGYVCLCGYSCG